MACRDAIVGACKIRTGEISRPKTREISAKSTVANEGSPPKSKKFSFTPTLARRNTFFQASVNTFSGSDSNPDCAADVIDRVQASASRLQSSLTDFRRENSRLYQSLVDGLLQFLTQRPAASPESCGSGRNRASVFGQKSGTSIPSNCTAQTWLFYIKSLILYDIRAI